MGLNVNNIQYLSSVDWSIANNLYFLISYCKYFLYLLSSIYLFIFVRFQFFFLLLSELYVHKHSHWQCDDRNRNEDKTSRYWTDAFAMQEAFKKQCIFNGHTTLRCLCLVFLLLKMFAIQQATSKWIKYYRHNTVNARCHVSP